MVFGAGTSGINADTDSDNVETDIVEDTSVDDDADETHDPETHDGDDISSHSYLVDFVKRLYTLVLQREYDQYGLDYWVNALEDGEKTGIETGYGFVFSKEYLDRNESYEDYVEMLYNVFLGRPSDEEGKAGWVELLEAGKSFEYVFSGFVNSSEYSEICDSYGIIRGEYSGTRSQDKNPGITGFIMRLYETVLGRRYDPDGLNMWCDILLNGSMTFEQVAAEFVSSEEFVQLDLDDEQYVSTLYIAFLGREADGYGISYWTGLLEEDMTREDLLAGFAGSDEFRDLIGRYTNEYNGVKMPLPNESYSTWADALLSSRGISIDTDLFEKDITELADIWTERGGAYRFGGKVIQSGSIDCSGYVTYLYRAVLGTISQTEESCGSSTYGNYFTGLQDTTYRGMWNDYVSVEYPMTEGVYNIRSTPALRFYVDRYGIGSPNLMDTREWVYYLDTVGVTSTTVTISQLRAMPYWDHNEERPQSFALEWLDEYKAGDIIIWFDRNGVSVHIGLYDGHGGVYHSSSFDYDMMTENNVGIQHSDLRAIGASTPHTSLSYLIIYHIT